MSIRQHISVPRNVNNINTLFQVAAKTICSCRNKYLPEHYLLVVRRSSFTLIRRTNNQGLGDPLQVGSESTDLHGIQARSAHRIRVPKFDDSFLPLVWPVSTVILLSLLSISISLVSVLHVSLLSSETFTDIN